MLELANSLLVEVWYQARNTPIASRTPPIMAMISPRSSFSGLTWRTRSWLTVGAYRSHRGPGEDSADADLERRAGVLAPGLRGRRRGQDRRRRALRRGRRGCAPDEAPAARGGRGHRELEVAVG